jgi:FkbM family methyltransferase
MFEKLQRKVVRRLHWPAMLAAAPLEIAGRVFVTPKIDNVMCDLSEPWMADLLAKLLPLKPGTFLDVGVNLGQTLLVVKALDAARRYVGVEPNPHCVAYAEKLIALNVLTDCRVIPVGLADATGLRRLQLYHGATVDSSASLVEGFRPEQPVSHIKLVPVLPFSAIDDAVDLSTLGLVKVDVEGGEAEVLLSMRQAITRQRPWLIVEILPCYEPANTARMERQQAVEALLRESGYVKFRITKTGGGHLDSLQGIDEIGIHSNLDWCDYVFCPQADAQAILGTL